LVQFTLGMIGAVVVAWYALEPLGGIGALPDETTTGSGMLGRLAEAVTAAGGEVKDVVDFLPDADHPTIPAVYFAVLLIAGWWRYAEGNGYIVQRLAASK